MLRTIETSVLEFLLKCPPVAIKEELKSREQQKFPFKEGDFLEFQNKYWMGFIHIITELPHDVVISLIEISKKDEYEINKCSEVFYSKDQFEDKFTNTSLISETIYKSAESYYEYMKLSRKSAERECYKNLKILLTI